MKRVLVADDDPVTVRMLEDQLTRWNYQPVTATDGDAAWRVLQSDDPPALALIDWMMPGMDGPSICRALRARSTEPYVYVILLTVRRERQDVIAGMDAGADDYLGKPFDPQELRVRLLAGQRVLTLQADLIATREALRAQVSRDPLTGMLNRSAVLEILGVELARVERGGVPLGLLMADLDHFKQVNDRRGHLVGDEVLREIGRRMRGAIRPYDSLGRFGGEEFLMTLPGCSARQAVSVAERLRRRVAERPIAAGGGEPLAITVSLGAASTEQFGAVPTEAMVGEADRALYIAKSLGRNRVELARPPERAPEPGLAIDPSQRRKTMEVDRPPDSGDRGPDPKGQ